MSYKLKQQVKLIDISNESGLLLLEDFEAMFIQKTCINELIFVLQFAVVLSKMISLANYSFTQYLVAPLHMVKVYT